MLSPLIVGLCFHCVFPSIFNCDITAELQDFSRFESKGVVLNVGQTLDINIPLKASSVALGSATTRIGQRAPVFATGPHFRSLGSRCPEPRLYRSCFSSSDAA
jgi:hypothetical protein